jgi:hypothetical protein
VRIRTIKPEFWTNETLALGCSDTDRLLAIGLLNYADDEGYFLSNPALVRSALRPFDDDSSIIRASLKMLQKVGWIELFDDVNGRKVGRIVNFQKHQRIDRPKPSEIKDLCKIDEESSNDRRMIEDESLLERKGTGNGTGNGIESLRDSSRTDAKASWSENGGFEIPESVLLRLQKAYPACDVERQAARAHEWLLANPLKRKKDHHRFLVSWLGRAQERGGDVASRPIGGRNARFGEVMSALDHAAQNPVKRVAPPGWRELLLEMADDPDMVPESWEECYPSVQKYALELYERKGEVA